MKPHELTERLLDKAEGELETARQELAALHEATAAAQARWSALRVERERLLMLIEEERAKRGEP